MGDAVTSARSLLFVPASDEAKLAKALATEADAVIADLEDAVAADAKEAARETLSRAFRKETGRTRIVRVNGVDSPYWDGDMQLVRRVEPDALMLPKATPEAAAALGDGPPVIAIVETAIGLRRSFETARTPGVAALALGAADLGAELGLEPRPDGLEILYARSQLVVDSAAAGLRAPFDVVHLDTRDGAGLERESRLARSLGFGGKLCIHPAQIEIVNREFGPSAELVAWAQAALAAYDDGLREGRGAVSMGGEMIDAPIAERARRIIEVAGREKQ